MARLVHGPTWSAPERTANGPTGGRWATGQGGQSNHQQCVGGSPGAGVPPRRVASRVGHRPRDTRPGQGRACRGGTGMVVRACAVGCSGVCAWTGSWALRRGPQLPGRRPAGHSSPHQLTGGKCVRCREVNLGGLVGAPGNLRPPPRSTRRGRRGCAWRATGASGSGSGLGSYLLLSAANANVRCRRAS
eukprot:COSAG06_NODE_22517_length_720_cov_12.998390_1_plen_188_part_10